MPGLTGFTHNQQLSQNWNKILSQMRDIISHKKYCYSDELFSDEFISGTRVHLNIIQKNKQPITQSGVFVWLDGEFYNQEKLSEKYEGIRGVSDPIIMLNLYIHNKDFSFLKDIDGIYSSVIYDSTTQRLLLITDRYGLRDLYWGIIDNCLVWSSEVKGFLEFPNFIPRINDQSVRDFFLFGYLLENHTWFEGIELLSSGSILCWDIGQGYRTITQYWWWDQIKQIDPPIQEEEIVKNLGNLLVRAINKRCNINEKIGVTLSGGLDSRALFAGIPNYQKSINTITFGKCGSEDIRIARIVTAIRNAVHTVIEINESNWIHPRIEGVWVTDGQLNLMHMHGIEGDEQIRSCFSINLDGFAGDLVLGGSYLIKNQLDCPISLELISKKTGINELSNIDISKYNNLKKSDFYFIQNRVRRFTHSGTKFLQIVIEGRKVFFDNELIEYAYSLPDYYRFNSNIYKKMLIKFFPDYYRNIPWQKTGFPINTPHYIIFLNYIKKIVCDRLRLSIKNLDFVQNNKNYTDYNNWIRKEPAKSLFISMLQNPKCLYQKYLPESQVILELENHMKGEDFSDNLCRYLTFEIWLQQIYNKKYRKGLE